MPRIDLRERLDEAGESVLERAVPVVGFESNRGLCCGDSLVRSADEARKPGGGEHSRKVWDGGLRRQITDFLGPSDRFEQLQREPQRRGMGRNRRRDHCVVAVGTPPERGTQVGQFPFRPVGAILRLGTEPLPPVRNRFDCEVRSMPVASLPGSTRVAERVPGELTDRLEQVVTGPACCLPALTRAFRSSDSRTSSISISSTSPTTAVMAARSNPPAHTDAHLRAWCVLKGE